ncbi:hypothetical protein ACM66B_006703 [Microbotryomycetes sp. NB124-2]
MSKTVTQSAVEALRTCLATCRAAVHAIDSEEPGRHGPASIKDVRHDSVTLAALSGKLSTELSLALKPPVTVAAVESTAAKLQDCLAKLRVCLGSCPRVGLLSRQIRETGLELLRAVERFLHGSLLGLELDDALKRKRQRDTNLRLTGEVWSLVEQVQQGIAANELNARRTEWKGMLALLDDCISEAVATFDDIEAEASGSSDAKSQTDGSDDETDAEHATGADTSCPRLVLDLLRLGRTLVQRLDDEASKAEQTEPDDAALQAVSTAVDALSACADDLVMSLEPPFDEVRVAVLAFVKAAATLERQIRALRLCGTDANWYDEWHVKLQRAADALSLIEML